MGLRGCVDAWGEPVKKPELAGMTERFKPAGTNKPEIGTDNKSAKPIKSAKPVAVPVPSAPSPSPSPKPRGRGRPKAADAAPWLKAGMTRRTYYRQQAKAKASKP